VQTLLIAGAYVFLLVLTIETVGINRSLRRIEREERRILTPAPKGGAFSPAAMIRLQAEQAKAPADIMSRFEAMDDSPKYRVQDFMLRQNTESSEMYWYVGVSATPQAPGLRLESREKLRNSRIRRC
jgi:hypothetical protein